MLIKAPSVMLQDYMIIKYLEEKEVMRKDVGTFKSIACSRLHPATSSAMPTSDME